MSINLESDIIETRFDAKRQASVYVAKRGERRWTVEVPMSAIQAHAGNKMARRKAVENYINTVMTRPADGET